jgi:hypothetical protein
VGLHNNSSLNQKPSRGSHSSRANSGSSRPTAISNGNNWSHNRSNGRQQPSATVTRAAEIFTPQRRTAEQDSSHHSVRAVPTVGGQHNKAHNSNAIAPPAETPEPRQPTLPEEVRQYLTTMGMCIQISFNR